MTYLIVTSELYMYGLIYSLPLSCTFLSNTLQSFIFFLLFFSFCSFIFACFAPTKGLKSPCTKEQRSSPSHVWRSCPVIYKLIRKEAVCNGRCEAKAFIFLAISSRESVLGLKWTNDANTKFISSKLNTNGNVDQEPLIPLHLLPELIIHQCWAGRLWSISLDDFGYVSPLIILQSDTGNYRICFLSGETGFHFLEFYINGNNTMHFFRGESCLLSLSIIILKFLHVLCILIVHFSSSISLSNILFVWLYYHVFFHSSVDEQNLNCFQFTNKAAINTYEKALFEHKLSYILFKYLGVGCLSHLVVFNILRNCQTYSKVVITFNIPISSLWEFQLFHILATFEDQS